LNAVLTVVVPGLNARNIAVAVLPEKFQFIPLRIGLSEMVGGQLLH
jgi:hypothetical protein